MQTAVHTRLLLLAGLLVLSLVVLAAGAQIVQADPVEGPGAPSATAAQIQQQAAAPAQHQPLAGAAVGAQGSGRVNPLIPAPVPGKFSVPRTGPLGTPSGATGLIVGVVIAAIAILLVVWAIVRGPRGVTAPKSEREAFCALHPDDAMCSA